MSTGDADVEDLLVAYLPRLRAYVRARAGAAIGPDESHGDVVASICREFLAGEEHFEFRDEAAFRSWLFTSAANKLAQRHRHRFAQKRSPDREVRLSDAGAIAADYSAVATPSQHMAAREQVGLLESALDALEPEHREVICHARLAELPTHEVAKIMNRTEGAVRALLGRALLKLARELKRVGLTPSRVDA